MNHLLPIVTFAVTALALFLVTFVPYYRARKRRHLIPDMGKTYIGDYTGPKPPAPPAPGKPILQQDGTLNLPRTDSPSPGAGEFTQMLGLTKNIHGTPADLKLDLRQKKIRPPQVPAKSKFGTSDVRVPMQIVISLVFLGAAIYIIVSRSFDPSDKHWAYGSAGTILGFWLKR
jgi:hypothetical protein